MSQVQKKKESLLLKLLVWRKVSPIFIVFDFYILVTGLFFSYVMSVERGWILSNRLSITLIIVIAAYAKMYSVAHQFNFLTFGVF